MTAASRDDTRRARGRGVWNTLTEPSLSVEKPDDRRRARLIASLVLAILLLTIIGLVARRRPAPELAVLGLLLAVAYGLSRTAYFRVGTLVSVVGLAVPSFLSTINAPELNTFRIATNLMWLVLPLLLGSLVFNRAQLLTLALGLVVGVILLGVFIPGLSLSLLLLPLGFLATVLTLSIFVVTVYQQDLEQIVRTSGQLRVTAQVSQISAVTRDLSDLLNTTVDLISRAFGFYHVQVFLIDPAGETALLRASTGEAGRELLRRGHRLPIGSTSIVGQVTARGEPLVASDVSTDPIHRRNELLPLTRSEMALPMRVGERVIGALDVQSTQVNAFGEEDIETVQIMANQLAVTIENARLLNEVTQRAADNERLLKETQANLQQIETLNRTLTRRGWHEYLRLRAKEGMLGYTLHAGQVVGDTRWTPGMRAAVQEQRVVVGEDSGPGRTLSLPLSVRGEVIGVLEIEGESAQTWTADDVELAQALAERLSMALDNARLLEQADTLARREQLVNEITQSVQKADSVDTLLQSALMELGRVLGASKGVVQLNPRAEEAGSTASGGGTGKLSLPADSVVSEEERA